jgi:hypothetical protein
LGNREELYGKCAEHIEDLHIRKITFTKSIQTENIKFQYSSYNPLKIAVITISVMSCLIFYLRQRMNSYTEVAFGSHPYDVFSVLVPIFGVCGAISDKRRYAKQVITIDRNGITLPKTRKIQWSKIVNITLSPTSSWKIAFDIEYQDIKNDELNSESLNSMTFVNTDTRIDTVELLKNFKSIVVCFRKVIPILNSFKIK